MNISEMELFYCTAPKLLVIKDIVLLFIRSKKKVKMFLYTPAALDSAETLLFCFRYSFLLEAE
jgi:hypothetical protein